jgi:hypothetical protein
MKEWTIMGWNGCKDQVFCGSLELGGLLGQSGEERFVGDLLPATPSSPTLCFLRTAASFKV